MLTCKQVSNSLARERYEAMSPLRRLGLRIHVMFCAVCGRYNRQVVEMQEGAQRFTENEQEGLDAGEMRLSEESRRAIRSALKE
ncbi:MAG: hypothetical protein AAF492_06345 [Verrucomicrobiota bacterium]